MTSPEQAVARINKVLDSDFDPQTAYPLRARLGRAVLGSARAASTFSHPPDAEWTRLLSRLNAATLHIMQPSEPFDSHWQEQWKGVLEDLRRIRQILIDTKAAER